ncbi:hypothetical protein Pelo_13732 [Pelomyxa schiedti]|nr:hypothetical protein Pelo_13732 [Pelomyxa schiedti]
MAWQPPPCLVFPWLGGALSDSAKSLDIFSAGLWEGIYHPAIQRRLSAEEASATTDGNLFSISYLTPFKADRRDMGEGIFSRIHSGKGVTKTSRKRREDELLTCKYKHAASTETPMS